jgi:hypothetical protein
VVLTGGSFGVNIAKNINEQAIALINEQVGFSLLTTCGEKGMLNLVGNFGGLDTFIMLLLLAIKHK